MLSKSTSHYFFLFFIFLYSFECLASTEIKTQEVSPELRGFSVSKLLNGIANTCNQLGNAVTAETKQEKKQAALGILGSLFSIASDMTAQEETKRTQQDMPQEEEMLTRTIGLAACLTNNINSSEWSLQELNVPLIVHFASLENALDREREIKECLRSPEGTKQLLDETFRTVKRFITDRVPFLIQGSEEHLTSALLLDRNISEAIQEEETRSILMSGENALAHLEQKAYKFFVDYPERKTLKPLFNAYFTELCLKIADQIEHSERSFFLQLPTIIK
jgi:hypothetical protein